MKESMKGARKWLVVGALAVTLAVGSVVALGSAAFAQGPQGGTSPTTQNSGPGFGPGMMGGPGGGFGMQGAPRGQDSLITIAAKVLGMTEADLRTALQSGKTIADVAKEKNVALDKIVDAVVADRADALKQQVTSGKLTQAQADQMLANMKTQVTKQLSEKFDPRGGGPNGAPQANHTSLESIAAKVLGITEAELRTALDPNKSIADVAKEKNVALDKIVDAAVSDHATQLKQAVTDGKLTQAQADILLSNFKIMVTAQLQIKHVQGLNGFGGGPQGGPHGGFGPGQGGPQGGPMRGGPHRP